MENEDKTFIKLYRSEKADELMKYPPAFILLCQIALRARRTDKFNYYNLESGESLIGDFWELGMSRSQYRTALKRLTASHFITIRTTNRGTVAKLIDQSVFDINAEVNQPTEPPSDSHQIATNKNDNNKKDNLLIEKIFFENSDKEKAIYENQGPLLEIIDSERWTKYIGTGVKKCSGQVLTADQVKALIKMFLLERLKPANQYNSREEILIHCIRWICSCFRVNKEDAHANKGGNHKDFRAFWKVYHNPIDAFKVYNSPQPVKESKPQALTGSTTSDNSHNGPRDIEKAGFRIPVPSELKEILDMEVTSEDLEFVAYKKSGLIWDLRHNISVYRYLIQSVPSNPPLKEYELYEIWRAFLMVGLSQSYYQNAKRFVDCFSRWMKDKMRESHVKDIRKAKMIDNALGGATKESYLTAMAAYSKQNNLITTN